MPKMMCMLTSATPPLPDPPGYTCPHTIYPYEEREYLRSQFVPVGESVIDDSMYRATTAANKIFHKKVSCGYWGNYCTLLVDRQISFVGGVNLTLPIISTITIAIIIIIIL